MTEESRKEENQLKPFKKHDLYQDQNILVDNFGRIARKLRISVTDRCNMRCQYCMPQDNIRWYDEGDLLNYHEITRLVSILTDLGVERIRLTGGEPLLRPKLEKLIRSLTVLGGIKSVSMTTNGLLLRDKSKLLRDAGLESVNISLDTFKSDRFKMINGVDGFNKVIEAIESANRVGLKVKINTVVIRGWNDDEVLDFANFARNTGHIVRFIEFMPLDGSGIWQPSLVYSKREMIDLVIRNIGNIKALSQVTSSHLDYANISNNNKIYSPDSNALDNKRESSDPATLYTFDDNKGIIGFIPSLTQPFCANCDRVRLTSDGRLLTCLFENPGFDLKDMLRSRKSDYYIKKKILKRVRKKPEGIVKIIRTKTLKPSLNLMHTIGG